MFNSKTLEQFGLSNNNGGLKHCYIETKVNKKRIRKRGRKHNKRRKDIKEVIKDILLHHKISDFIATNEMDVYWQNLYMLYEYTIYTKRYITKILLTDDNVIYYDNDYELIHMLEKLQYIEDSLYNILAGYFELLVRLTFKKRFWGWKFFYADYFYPEFMELCLSSLRDLTFDPHKAKPSVYFINACWFKGIQITQDIMNKLKTEQQFYFNYNNGALMFSDNNDCGFISENMKKPDTEFDDILFDTECLDVDFCKKIVNEFKSQTNQYTEQTVAKAHEAEVGKIKLDDSSESNKQNNFSIVYANDVVEGIIGVENNITKQRIINKIFEICECSSIDKILSNRKMLNKLKDNIDNILKELNIEKDELFEILSI